MPPRHPGSVWLEQNWHNLPNNHWVAASSGGLVASYPSLDDVLAEVQRQQLHPSDVAIAFVTFDTLQ
jgi:hypothetical protein